MSWKRRVLLIISVVGCGSVQGSSARPDAGDPGAPDGADGSIGADGADGSGGADAGAPVPVPRIKASNTVSRADLVTGIAPLVVPAGKIYVIDTDQGTVVDAAAPATMIRAAGAGLNSGIYYRADNQNRAFFAIERLTVEDTATLRGVGGRALVLIAEGPIELHGIIDVSAGHCAASDAVFCAGPGGGRGGDTNAAAAGCSPGQAGTGDTGSATGGGGGGFASKGGAGGAPLIITIAGSPSVRAAVRPTPFAAIGAGGSGAGCPAPALESIQGGSGGHHGGAFFVTTAGGGGGGAVQVTSYTSITAGVGASGHASGVWAGGAGGSTGHPLLHAPSAGSGGGSGGAIVLEAPSVTLGAGVVLAANGGGGGAGQLEAAGQAGTFGSTPALGGGASGAGIGGAGAALGSEAIDGAAGLNTATSAPSGGGGGGGIGRIRINTIELNVAAQSVVSPTASINVPAATE